MAIQPPDSGSMVHVIRLERITQISNFDGFRSKKGKDIGGGGLWGKLITFTPAKYEKVIDYTLRGIGAEESISRLLTKFKTEVNKILINGNQNSWK